MGTVTVKRLLLSRIFTVVVKYECIGYYQKRVGCRLRKLKKRVKGLKSLTDAMIDKLQNYFGITLRSNCTSVNEMAQAIMASLFHVCSSKERNLHDHCKKGRGPTVGANINAMLRIKLIYTVLDQVYLMM